MSLPSSYLNKRYDQAWEEWIGKVLLDEEMENGSVYIED
jgi:hypothetical protein